MMLTPVAPMRNILDRLFEPDHRVVCGMAKSVAPLFPGTPMTSWARMVAMAMTPRHQWAPYLNPMIRVDGRRN